nr:hypothetical protein [Tanacetum cinerariifolium]
PRRPPLPDHDWNKTLPAAQEDAQSWISDLARQTDARSSFNELLDTPLDFSNFIMNQLGVATLTPKLLAGPTYELMRGSCNSLTKLKYHLEEVYKATIDQLDWVNPEDVDDQTKGSDDKEGEKADESDDDDDDQDEAEKVNDVDNDEEEISKINEQEATESGEGDDKETESDEESEEEETTEKEEESFDLIPITP